MPPLPPLTARTARTDRGFVPPQAALHLSQRREGTKARRRAPRAHTLEGHLSIREGKWKLIVHPGSGGWTPLGMRFRGEKPNDQTLAASDVPPMGLYNLDQDPGEYDNLLEQHPQIARDLVKTLKQTIAGGRSTPGAPQDNNGRVPLKLPKGW